MSDLYILDDERNPVRVKNIDEWGDWFQDFKMRRVAETHIGKIRVSTVFLGIDHSFGGGPPILFETMIFGGELDQWQERCCTWDAAVKMHNDAVELVHESESGEEAS